MDSGISCLWKDDSECVPCVRNGSTFVRLFNLSRCCLKSASDIGEDIIGIITNELVCPPTGEIYGAGFEWSGLLTGLVGAACAGGLAIGCGMLWRCFARRRRQIHTFPRGAQEEIELMDTLVPQNYGTLNNDGLNNAREAARALNFTVDDTREARVLIDHSAQAAYGQRGNLPRVVTFANPVYEILSAPPALPPRETALSPTATGGSSIVPYHDTMAQLETTAAVNHGHVAQENRRKRKRMERRLAAMTPAVEENSDAEEDDKVLESLARWGNGRILLKKKKVENTATTEWEASTEL